MGETGVGKKTSRCHKCEHSKEVGFLDLSLPDQGGETDWYGEGEWELKPVTGEKSGGTISFTHKALHLIGGKLEQKKKKAALYKGHKPWGGKNRISEGK